MHWRLTEMKAPGLLLVLLCGLGSGLALAADEPIEPRKPVEDRVTPLENQAPMENKTAIEQSNTPWLVDHTTSNFGNVFFRAFAQNWRSKNIPGASVVTVEEVREALWAYRVRIWLNDRLLTQALFYPNQARNVPDLGIRTAEFAYTRLLDMQTPK